MVSNKKQLKKKVIDIDSYKKLVLTHLYVLCKSRCVPLTRLGKDELKEAGARIVKNEFGVRGIEVDIPPESERDLRADLLRVHIAENKEFLPEKVKKKKKGRFVRGKKRPGTLANAQTMDEGLIGSTSSSVQPKDRF
jgi:hypothetical protein